MSAYRCMVGDDEIPLDSEESVHALIMGWYLSRGWRLLEAWGAATAVLCELRCEGWATEAVPEEMFIERRANAWMPR